MTGPGVGPAPLRWQSYFLAQGIEFGMLWRQLATSLERRVLLICGAGFDPRATNAATEIARAGVAITACSLVEFHEGPSSPSLQYAEAAASNRSQLEQLITGGCTPLVIEMRTADGRGVGGRKLAAALSEPERYRRFTDVIVDITSLPRGLYFPLIGTLLELWTDRQIGLRANLHVAVCENAETDRRIAEEGGDKAEWVHGFGGGLSRTAEAELPRIWAPVLGERQATRLKRIYDLVKPREISPVLPFPSRDPRRGDSLLGEYRELLFDSWEVEPRDIMYAAEQNPFDVYRQLCGLDQRYASALRRFGGAKTVVSAHSSKLLSLGVLLAAFERGLAVPQVEPTGYVVEGGLQEADSEGELFDIWLQGEPYGEH